MNYVHQVQPFTLFREPISVTQSMWDRRSVFVVCFHGRESATKADEKNVLFVVGRTSRSAAGLLAGLRMFSSVSIAECSHVGQVVARGTVDRPATCVTFPVQPS